MINPASLDWSLIRSVLAVADTGSLSAAARETGQSQPTLGRHIKTAEDSFGAALFARHARGFALTEFGRALMPAMRQMQDGARALDLALAGHDEAATGPVRLTASRFVSAFLLPPILAGLRHSDPGITIDLVATDTTENLLFHEADLAIRMYRPEQLDMITRHLGALELGLYATRGYLARRGVPETWEDCAAHDFLGYDRDDRIIKGMRAIGLEVDRNFFALRCDDQVIYWHLLCAGAGIGVSQRAAAALNPDLVEVLPDLPLPHLPVWLTAHETLRHSPRVARVWEALAAGLSPLLS